MVKKHTSGFQGVAFGIMGGVVTILGVMLGLSTTGNKQFTELGILVAGLADSFSDAAAMYVSEETEGIHTKKEVVATALATLFGKIASLILLMTPVLLLPLREGAIVSVLIGVFLLTGLSFYIKKDFKEKIRFAVEYILLAIVVAMISYSIGNLAQIILG